MTKRAHAGEGLVMQHNEFRIGEMFWTAVRQFKCTDVASLPISDEGTVVAMPEAAAGQ